MKKKKLTLNETHPLLALQWDYEANDGLTPQDATAGSNKQVGWVCDQGHKWIAAISNRARGAGCPFCSGRRPIIGETDLATLYPELAAQWDYEANGDLTPQDVTAWSNKKTGWVCRQGHKWFAAISSRARGAGCPFCSGRIPIVGETDLATLLPGLAAQWDYDANGGLRPQDVTAHSGKKVGWVCDQGHKWFAPIYIRADGTGCPYCAGEKPVVGENDLGTLFPELAAQWDYEKNGGLTPQDVAARSHKKVGWICEQGHKWIAAISDRTNGTGCPFCSGRRPIIGETDLATIFPELAAQWDYDANGGLTPQDVTAHSGKKVGWICEQGHKWFATINNRAGGSGCPYCSR